MLPGAIDKAIYVALKPNDGTVCRVYSLDYDETVELDLHGEKPSQQWACYVYGVCQEMEKRGALILPFDMAFGGDVPLGAASRPRPRSRAPSDSRSTRHTVSGSTGNNWPRSDR